MTSVRRSETIALLGAGLASLASLMTTFLGDTSRTWVSGPLAGTIEAESSIFWQIPVAILSFAGLAIILIAFISQKYDWQIRLVALAFMGSAFWIASSTINKLNSEAFLNSAYDIEVAAGLLPAVVTTGLASLALLASLLLKLLILRTSARRHGQIADYSKYRRNAL